MIEANSAGLSNMDIGRYIQLKLRDGSQMHIQLPDDAPRYRRFFIVRHDGEQWVQREGQSTGGEFQSLGWGSDVENEQWEYWCRTANEAIHKAYGK